MLFEYNNKTIYYDSITNTFSDVVSADNRRKLSFSFESVYTVTEIAQLLTCGMQQLILCLTENCNNRCEYCCYHDKFQKQFAKGTMCFETAKTAVDFFMAHSTHSLRSNISFYGGEPLLQLDIMSRIITYTNSHYAYRNISYNFTTNGLLLDNDKFISFLVDNDVSVLVSLDGPPELHDRYRRDAQGNATYERIITNLRRIMKDYPEYFYRRIHYNAVLCPPYDMDLLNDFNSRIMQPYRLSRLNKTPYFTEHFCQGNNDCDKDISFDFIGFGQMSECVKRYTIERLRYIYPVFTKQDHSKKQADKVCRINTCVPLFNRLFIRPDGSIHICESVNEKDEYLSLGNIWGDILLEKSISLVDHLIRIRNSSCQECWAFRFCRLCFLSISESGIDPLFCSNSKDLLKREIQFFLNDIAPYEDRMSMFN